MTHFDIPDWFTTENAPYNSTSAICDAVNKFLQYSDNNNILEESRMLLHPLDIAQCDLTFAYVLLKLLRHKSVIFLPPTEQEKELQVHHRVFQKLFPREFEQTEVILKSRSTSVATVCSPAQSHRSAQEAQLGDFDNAQRRLSRTQHQAMSRYRESANGLPHQPHNSSLETQHREQTSIFYPRPHLRPSYQIPPDSRNIDHSHMPENRMPAVSHADNCPPQVRGMTGSFSRPVCNPLPARTQERGRSGMLLNIIQLLEQRILANHLINIAFPDTR